MLTAGAPVDELSALALTLYPSLEHDEIAVGPYLHEVAPEALPVEGFTEGAGGLELRWRMVGVRREEDGDDVWAKENALRAWRDADGAVRLDRLELTAVPLMGFRVRPELGEGFDWTIGSGRREVGWAFGNEAAAQWRVYSPIALAPIGVSNTDQDDDSKLKYQMSVLGGLGGDVVGRVIGPVGAQLRVEGSARSARRFANDTSNNVRHEVQAVAEAGLTWFSDRQAWTVGGWVEHLTQWDPRDGGPQGLDRQYVAGGVRVAARLYAEAEPELAPMDLESLFGAIEVPVPEVRNEKEESEDAPVAVPAEPPPEPEPDEEDETVPPDESPSQPTEDPPPDTQNPPSRPPAGPIP
jgi:hypothetical protein